MVVSLEAAANRNGSVTRAMKKKGMPQRVQSSKTSLQVSTLFNIISNNYWTHTPCWGDIWLKYQSSQYSPHSFLMAAWENWVSYLTRGRSCFTSTGARHFTVLWDPWRGGRGWLWWVRPRIITWEGKQSLLLLNRLTNQDLFTCKKPRGYYPLCHIHKITDGK